VAALSNRLDETSTWLVDFVKGGAPLDLAELTRDSGRVAPRLIIMSRPLTGGLPPEATTRFVAHRRRSARVTVVEATRRVFRGRAPPSVSICSL